jgi:hypothetical protein
MQRVHTAILALRLRAHREGQTLSVHAGKQILPRFHERRSTAMLQLLASKSEPLTLKPVHPAH